MFDEGTLIQLRQHKIRRVHLKSIIFMPAKSACLVAETVVHLELERCNFTGVKSAAVLTQAINVDTHEQTP